MILKSRPAFVLLLFVILYACCNHVSFAVETNDGSIIERKAYSFPTYEQAVKDTDVEDYAPKEAYQRAVNDSGFEFQKLKYVSEGLKVIAYLYKPVRVEGRILPAIIFNRGSTVRGDIAPELVVFFHRLASEGFIIIAPMYRQSDGGDGRDEVGGADVNDLMNVAPLAKSLGFIDMNNLFMYGESRGGMMTYQAIKRRFPVNAAAVFGAFTDMEALIKYRPQIYQPKTLKQIWPDFDIRKDEIIKSRSALYWPEMLDAPLLIMHGGADWSVNPSQSLTIAQKLQDLGKTYELIIYAEDGHILSRNQEDRDRRAIAWFKKHMKPKSSTIGFKYSPRQTTL
ncbi:MAG TPA: prolyl oligopeptidase family serine peptidase [Pyrinomonadaceae bacterium]|jgi:dipeptidyl aminopeptidase/acylaminoacyl peptidase